MEEIRKSGIVDIVLKAEVTAIDGRNRVERVVIKHEERKLEKEVDAVMIGIGLSPNSEIFTNLGLKMDKYGFILTDRAQRTNIEGIFAVGDVTHGRLRLITVAAAHGAIASHYIYSCVKEPYWAMQA